MNKTSTTEEFISKAKAVHGNKYNYEKVCYINNHTPVTIVCNQCNHHFQQKPKTHLLGGGPGGCSKCSKNYRRSTKEFIEEAKVIHGNKYNYEKVYYTNSHTKVTIVCNRCNHQFQQAPFVHLKGKGCPKCGKKYRRSTKEFIDEAKIIHGDKYDYSKSVFVKVSEKICIICPDHGEFWQTPNNHINQKQGCPKCSHAGFSKISIQFLNNLAAELKVNIQHAENLGEYIIPDPELKCLYKADGMFREKSGQIHIVDFLGDFWHGHPKMYNPDSICKIRSMTFGELYKKTMERLCRIKALGYKVLYIWEVDYRTYLEDNVECVTDLMDYCVKL